MLYLVEPEWLAAVWINRTSVVVYSAKFNRSKSNGKNVDRRYKLNPDAFPLIN